VNMEMAGDGTAIGMGIATALNRLKQSEAKSKLIILLTDGVNNAGAIEPLSAAKLAKDLSVKVYTIGVGKEGGAPIPIDHPVYGRVYARNPDGSLYLPDIDESQLKKIAALTGGRYFRAHNEKELHQIYQEINALEKTKIKTTQYHNITEYFPYVLWGVLIFMILEIVVSSFILVRVP